MHIHKISSESAPAHAGDADNDARRAQRHVTSDWMELERERGISVTSSVLQFDYEGYRINLLDTPGHEDFSEDTYRTLVAADSAVMLLDNRKGVEERTRQLFEVCKLQRVDDEARYYLRADRVKLKLK